MQKVFDVEIDVDLLAAAERTRSGFGAVKAMRQPLPMCTTSVDPCYENRTGELGCVNPEFHELPVGEPTFRIFARIEPGGLQLDERTQQRCARERARGAGEKREPPRSAATTAANAIGIAIPPTPSTVC